MEDIIEQLILRSKHSQRIYLTFSILLFLVGAAIIPFSFLSEGDIKIALCILGAFVSTLSFFPAKEYISKKDNIALLSSLLSRLRADRLSIGENEIKIIEELVLKIK